MAELRWMTLMTWTGHAVGSSTLYIDFAIAMARICLRGLGLLKMDRTPPSSACIKSHRNGNLTSPSQRNPAGCKLRTANCERRTASYLLPRSHGNSLCENILSPGHSSRSSLQTYTYLTVESLVCSALLCSPV